MKKKLLLAFTFAVAAAQPTGVRAMNRHTMPLLFGAAIAGASFFAGYAGYFLEEPSILDQPTEEIKNTETIIIEEDNIPYNATEERDDQEISEEALVPLIQDKIAPTDQYLGEPKSPVKQAGSEELTLYDMDISNEIEERDDQEIAEEELVPLIPDETTPTDQYLSEPKTPVKQPDSEELKKYEMDISTDGLKDALAVGNFPVIEFLLEQKIPLTDDALDTLCFEKYQMNDEGIILPGDQQKLIDFVFSKSPTFAVQYFTLSSLNPSNAAPSILLTDKKNATHVETMLQAGIPTGDDIIEVAIEYNNIPLMVLLQEQNVMVNHQTLSKVFNSNNKLLIDAFFAHPINLSQEDFDTFIAEEPAPRTGYFFEKYKTFDQEIMFDNKVQAISGNQALGPDGIKKLKHYIIEETNSVKTKLDRFIEKIIHATNYMPTQGYEKLLNNPLLSWTFDEIKNKQLTPEVLLDLQKNVLTSKNTTFPLSVALAELNQCILTRHANPYSLSRSLCEEPIYRNHPSAPLILSLVAATTTNKVSLLKETSLELLKKYVDVAKICNIQPNKEGEMEELLYKNKKTILLFTYLLKKAIHHNKFETAQQLISMVNILDDNIRVAIDGELNNIASLIAREIAMKKQLGDPPIVEDSADTVLEYTLNLFSNKINSDDYYENLFPHDHTIMQYEQMQEKLQALIKQLEVQAKLKCMSHNNSFCNIRFKYGTVNSKEQLQQKTTSETSNAQPIAKWYRGNNSVSHQEAQAFIAQFINKK